MKGNIVPLGPNPSNELGKELEETNSAVSKEATFKRWVQCVRENKSEYLEWRKSFYAQMTMFSRRNAAERDQRLINLLNDYDCNGRDEFTKMLNVAFGFSTSGARNQIVEMSSTMETFYDMRQSKKAEQDGLAKSKKK